MSKRGRKKKLVEDQELREKKVLEAGRKVAVEEVKKLEGTPQASFRRVEIAMDNERRRQRLLEAIELKGWSQTRFEQQMEETGVPGCSVANVRRILKGTVKNPPVDFYIAAAELLGQPLSTLLTGYDETVDREARARLSNTLVKFREGLIQSFPLADRVYDLEEVRGILILTFRHYSFYQAVTRKGQVDPARKSGRAIGKALAAPLKALGIPPEELSDAGLIHFIIGTCQALTLLWWAVFVDKGKIPS